MKNQHLKVLLALFLLSFKTIGQSKTDSSFVINGSINANGGIVQLLCKNPIDSANNSKPMKVYAAEITNGTFTINGDLDFPAMYAFQYVRNDSLLYSSDYFLVDAGTQKAEIQLDNNMPKLLNASMNHYYTTLFYSMNKRYQRDKKWFRAFADSLKAVYPTQMPDSLANVLIGIKANQALRDTTVRGHFFTDMNDSYLALWVLYDRFYSIKFDGTFDTYYESLSDEIKQSKYGQLLNLKLNRASPTGVGAKFPFSLAFKNLKTQTCEKIQLKADYTYVYFWWGRCGSCIGEFSELKKLYDAYANKGFEIMHISTDTSDGLAFLEKIRKKHNLPWAEYLDENQENIQQIFLKPYFPIEQFLLDKDGVVLKRSINTQELKSFLEKTLY
ncbi:redoxin domain-containing protein [Emticicia soli]|uniref:Redoxin domain-containing protein n=1 Tax=Emticicia soli TaxID=2027878 RepID=A0ABW5JD47_9BACT